MASSKSPVVIKKVVKKSRHSRHGGAWKIAYADFVTAMMAFFLMMWLINIISEDQKKGIADYFAPNIVTLDYRQSGQDILGGNSPQGENAARKDTNGEIVPSTQERVDHPETSMYANAPQKRSENSSSDIEAAPQVLRPLSENERRLQDKEKIETIEPSMSADQKEEQQQLRDTVKSIEGVLEKNQQFGPHMQVRIERDGISINLMERNQRPLFASGSPVLKKNTQDMLIKIAELIQPLNNKIRITGHTDAYNYTNTRLYSNWELSCDRANSTRRFLVGQNIDPSRFKRISGAEATDPMNPDDVYAPENRRIQITLLREHPLTLDQLKEIEATPRK